MKTVVNIHFRFAKQDGIEAARKRAEVGAPEGLSATLQENVEADMSLDALDRAERAGLLHSHGSYAQLDGSWEELPAEHYALEAPDRIERWLDAQLAKRARDVENAIAQVLEKPVDVWVKALQVQRPWCHQDLQSAVFADPRVQAREAEASELAGELRTAAHAKQLRRYEDLDVTKFVRQHRDWFSGHRPSTRDAIRRRGYELLTDAEIEPRVDELLQALRDLERAEEQAKREATQQFAEHAIAMGGEAATATERKYSVKGAVLGDVAKQIAVAVEQEPIAVLYEGTERYDDATWTRRDSPRESQLALETKLEEVAKTVRRPACLDVGVGAVCRVELPVEDEYDTETRKLTGVVVTLSSPITKDRCLVFSAE